MLVNEYLSYMIAKTKKVNYRIDVEDRRRAVMFLNGKVLTGVTHGVAINERKFYRADIMDDLEDENSTATFGHELYDGIVVVSEVDNSYKSIEMHTFKQLKKLGKQNNITIVALGFGKKFQIINKRREL